MMFEIVHNDGTPWDREELSEHLKDVVMYSCNESFESLDLCYITENGELYAKDTGDKDYFIGDVDDINVKWNRRFEIRHKNGRMWSLTDRQLYHAKNWRHLMENVRNNILSFRFFLDDYGTLYMSDGFNIYELDDDDFVVGLKNEE